MQFWNLPYTGNQKHLLQILRAKPDLTRAELVQITGLSTLTVTRYIADFISDGIVSECGTAESTGGRKAAKLRINPDYAYVLSLDVGTYSIKFGVVRMDGSLIHQQIVSKPPHAIPANILSVDQVRDELEKLLEQFGRKKFLGLGIGISGLVDYDTQTILFCPNIDGWNGISVEEAFAQPLQIPVMIDTSARCMALAEQAFGCGQQISNQVFVSIGYSIGAGIIADQKLFRGANGAAGELGHVRVEDSDELCSCGKVGCLELYGTLLIIQLRLGSALEEFHGFSPLRNAVDDIHHIPPEAIAQASVDGDKIVNTILSETGKLIGIALANMINILNPELMILGGSVIEFFPVVFEEIQRTVKEHSLVTTYRNLSIEKSTLGINCPIIGSGMQLIHRYFEQ